MLITHNKLGLFLVITLMMLGLAGCSGVLSKHPVGAEPHALNAEALNGTWFSGGEYLKLKVMDEPKGKLKLAWVEDKANDLRFEYVTCQVLEGNNALYINLIESSENDTNGFIYWGRLKLESDKLVVWLPSPQAFKKAVAEHKLDAIVEESEGSTSVVVKLTGEPKQIMALIDSDPMGYFDLQNPVTLFKVAP